MVSQRDSITTVRNDSSRVLDRRHVHRYHWQALRKLQSNLMEPKDFYAKWDITHKQIATICFCCANTVDGWFVRTSNKRQASLIHKFILGLVNKLWSDLSNKQENN